LDQENSHYRMQHMAPSVAYPVTMSWQGYRPTPQGCAVVDQQDA